MWLSVYGRMVSSSEGLELGKYNIERTEATQHRFVRGLKRQNEAGEGPVAIAYARYLEFAVPVAKEDLTPVSYVQLTANFMIH
ncbi:hypothetical protein N7510_010160 [Penicillium lagena]|uniref:uncharacterized protein n=1 Tax=Penicillium lagena TaxID=94218 RepID=UPI002541AC16|nr:uncharacterized protein N7510_010160 [Penicillium lagena]KAJ5605006.1 hypothetical protein N7510_010160 [Penicillium lagena]